MNDELRLIWGKYLSAVATSRRQELEAIDELLNELGKPFTQEGSASEKTEKPTKEEFEANFWENKQGSQGPYQLTSKKANNNHPNFRKLQAYLKKNGGFSILHGYKSWIFNSNSDLIGRKPQ